MKRFHVFILIYLSFLSCKLEAERKLEVFCHSVSPRILQGNLFATFIQPLRTFRQARLTVSSSGKVDGLASGDASHHSVSPRILQGNLFATFIQPLRTFRQARFFECPSSIAVVLAPLIRADMLPSLAAFR